MYSNRSLPLGNQSLSGRVPGISTPLGTTATAAFEMRVALSKASSSDVTWRMQFFRLINASQICSHALLARGFVVPSHRCNAPRGDHTTGLRSNRQMNNAGIVGG